MTPTQRSDTPPMTPALADLPADLPAALPKRCAYHQTYQPWTQAEIQALIDTWPHGGIRAARAALPGRTDQQLKGKSYALNLVVLGKKAYRRFETSEFIDAAIRRAYRTGKPDLAALEKTTGRDAGWLKYRAQVLGVSTVRGGRPNCNWTPDEDALLSAGADQSLSVTTIQSRLRKAGHQRSLAAITSRITTLGLSLRRDAWTASDVSQIFDLDLHSVRRWISSGALPAKRCGGLTGRANPDAETFWSIQPEAIRDFMLRNPEKWDHRRMRKEVLLDLLCGREFNAAVRKGAG